jgi:hypothetical protein
MICDRTSQRAPLPQQCRALAPPLPQFTVINRIADMFIVDEWFTPSVEVSGSIETAN